jgi:hypothetical protein
LLRRLRLLAGGRAHLQGKLVALRIEVGALEDQRHDALLVAFPRDVDDLGEEIALLLPAGDEIASSNASNVCRPLSTTSSADWG